MAEKNPDELGALWEKEGGKGPYMTGTINGVAVVCFRNTRAHDNPKAPQWRVMKSKPREEGRTSAPPVSDRDVPF
jgi:hypothetical protein